MPHLPTLLRGQPWLWAGLLAATSFRAMAQTTPDSTRLSYGEEVMALPAAPLRVQAEDRGLWKLGLNNFLLGSAWFGPDDYYTRYGVHLAYERRLGRSAWTVLGEVSPALIRYRPTPGAALQRSLTARAQVAGRYYYNQERRLRLGRNTTNFSANYVSLGLGTGLGRQARETPFYYYNNQGRWLGVDVALLYGLQRRWGRYGFVDANVGVSSLLSRGRPALILNGSLRVGLALGSQPAAPYSPQVVPRDKDEALLPRAYVGVQLGGYAYRVHYATRTPYQGLSTLRWRGLGTYEQLLATPYVYAGYYLRPRLAVQVGVQRQQGEFHTSTTGSSPTYSHTSTTQEHDLAVPVLVRYGLTRSFLQRVQLDAVGGLVPEWSSVSYEEQMLAGGQLEAYGFQRSTFGLHASLGLNLGYGFGRRRRVQATAEAVALKSLRREFQVSEPLSWGASLGLRYRFGYH